VRRMMQAVRRTGTRRWGTTLGASVVVHAAVVTTLVLAVPGVSPWDGAGPPVVHLAVRSEAPIVEALPRPEPEEIPADPDHADPDVAPPRFVVEADVPTPPLDSDHPPTAPPLLALPDAAALTARLGPPRRPKEPEGPGEAPPVGVSASAPRPKPVVRAPVRIAARLLTRTVPRTEGPAGGEVLLRVEVKTDGTAGHVTVAESRGGRRLERIALEWAEDLRFEPATVDGRAVASIVPIRVVF